MHGYCQFLQFIDRRGRDYKARWQRSLEKYDLRIRSLRLPVLLVESMRKMSPHILLLAFLRISWLMLMLGILSRDCSAREKNDVVQLVNGDHLTCQIIKLEKGYLYVKLPYADGTVALDWSKVSGIKSDQSFVITGKDGRRYTTKLKSITEGSASEELQLEVPAGSQNEVLLGINTVGIDQTENRFLRNFHGGLNIGFNFTKQQDRAQYSLDSNATYARTKWISNAYYDSSFSGGGNASTLRNDLRIDSSWQLRSPNNFYRGTAEFLHNGEQQLDLRTTLGAALGRYFRHTNNSLITSYSGLVWNRERYSAASTTSQSGNTAEGVVGAQLNFFRFKTTNFLADARVYPSVTDLGRTRFDLNTSYKLRIAKDLYWQLSYYLNFDSRPPQSLPKTDYGTTSSLGWTF